jgi:hypothetical protein
MILASPNDRPEFTPAGQDEATAKTYVVRVPLLLDRARFERETIAAGGRRVGVFDTIAELANAARALLAEDDPDRAAFLASIDGFRARLKETAEAVQAARGEEREAALKSWVEALSDQRMNDLTVELRKHWPALRDLEADAMTYPLVRGMVAARMFLVSWRGYDAKLKRDARGVHDESLIRIPEAHLIGLGSFVENLFAPSDTERGN